MYRLSDKRKYIEDSYMEKKKAKHGKERSRTQIPVTEGLAATDKGEGQKQSSIGDL